MTEPDDPPLYLSDDQVPTKILRGEDGGLVAWALSFRTGGWRNVSDEAFDILYDSRRNTFMRTRENFIYEVERVRASHYRLPGPLGAIYEETRKITEPDGLTRHISRADAASLRPLFGRSYPMYEAMLRDLGDPGADLEAAAAYPPGAVT